MNLTTKRLFLCYIIFIFSSICYFLPAQPKTYIPVTSSDEIEHNSNYLLIGFKKKVPYALSMQNTNNRAALTVKVQNNSSIQLEPASSINTKNPYEIRFEFDTKTSRWLLYDEINAGYLSPLATDANGLAINTTKAYWDIQISSEGIASLICTNSKYSRIIMGFNSTSSIFACYSNNQDPIYLYKESNLPVPDFYFSNTNAKVFLQDRFIKPILYNESDNSIINYTSSNNEVASINSHSGEIDIHTPGKTTISASIESNLNFAKAKTSFLLTVSRKGMLMSTDLQDWEERNSYGGSTYKNEETGISINSCIIDNYTYPQEVSLMGPCSRGSIRINAKSGSYPAGIITFPPLSTIKRVELNMVKSTTSAVNVDLYNGNKLLTTFELSRTGNTYYYDIPKDEQNNEFNFILKNPTGTVYIFDVNIFQSNISSVDNNKTMRLNGRWDIEELAGLDITEITSVDMRAIEIPEGIIELKQADEANTLIYVSKNAPYPDSWKNVITDNEASSITLQDNYAFHCISSFTANQLNYKRLCWTDGGLETICIPFEVEQILDEDNNEVKYNLQEFNGCIDNTVYFRPSPTNKIIANKPYLIKFEQQEAQQSEYQFIGSAIAQTNDLTDDLSLQGNYLFKGVFTETSGEGKFLMNGLGNKFSIGAIDSGIKPFRCYLENRTAGEIQIVNVSYDTNNISILSPDNLQLLVSYYDNILEILSIKQQTIHLFSMDGRIYRSLNLQTGKNQFNDIPKGVYLINQQKIIIK